MSAPQYIGKRLTGRCANGAARDHGRIFHAVLMGAVWATALCGAKPGKLSVGWSTDDAGQISCPKCQKKMEKLGGGK